VLLNLFFGGKLAAMPARSRATTGVTFVIRPLIYCAEAQLAALATERRFRSSRAICAAPSPEAQRKQMKALIGELERSHHQLLRQTMLAALGQTSCRRTCSTARCKGGGARRRARADRGRRDTAISSRGRRRRVRDRRAPARRAARRSRPEPPTIRYERIV